MRRRLPCLHDKGGRMTQVAALAVGLDALRQWFNDNSSSARIIAIQSAT
jgi:hypothetical protein